MHLPQQVATEETTPTLGAPALNEVVEATDDATVIHEEVTVLEEVPEVAQAENPAAQAATEVQEDEEARAPHQHGPRRTRRRGGPGGGVEERHHRWRRLRRGRPGAAE